MTKLKIIMDSGKEYETEAKETAQEIISIFNKMTPLNQMCKMFNLENVIINPSHISSIEVKG